MSGNPQPFPVPTRREPRGEFPDHSDVIRPLLTLEQAARMARDRLETWRRDHGH
jgi:Arc/MetJ-type ribon-helix-helix transcriptional regulator